MRVATGLLKRCPRCGALGEVFMEKDANGDMWCPIVWPHQRPDMYTVGDLFDPENGCGFDEPKTHLEREEQIQRDWVQMEGKWVRKV